MATPPNADERGSIVAVTNGAGAASGTGFGINTYDEYGAPGPSNLGRFLLTDPIGFGGGMNLYAYVGNDPVMTMEPNFVGSGAHVISVQAPPTIPFSVRSVVDLSSMGYDAVNIIVIPNTALSQLFPANVIGFVPRPGR